MNREGALLIFAVIACLLCGYFAGRSDQKGLTQDRSRIVMDSMKILIDRKDSLLTKKQEEYENKKSSDSVSLYKINRSIKNLYYEIKQQSENTYFVRDSLFSDYVDSIRTAKGFNRIQY